MKYLEIYLLAWAAIIALILLRMIASRIRETRRRERMVKGAQLPEFGYCPFEAKQREKRREYYANIKEDQERVRKCI